MTLPGGPGQHSQTASFSAFFGIRILAGIQAGMLGGVMVIGWIAVASLLFQIHPALIPNLLSEVFYGSRSLTTALGFPTISGLAVLLVQSGLASVVFSAVIPPGLTLRPAILGGVLFSLAAHWAAYRFIWRVFSPHLEDFAPPGLIWPAAILFGVCLGFSPWLIRSFTKEFLLE